MTGKLEFSFNSNRLGEFVLDKEVMTIGRREDNDIRIENLAVSGHHAKLLTLFDDSFLEDLDSTNGTYVNGKPIDKHPLRHGDIIVIGKHELRYVNEANALGDEEQKTVLIRRNPEANKGDSGNDKHRNGAPDVHHAILQILNGKAAGRELALVKDSVKLGKAGGEVIQINRRPDGHFIICLEQPNGKSAPMINGEEIGSRAVKLHNHDVIEINRLKIEYFINPQHA
jgi:pSer/pThr/pTyr-binding forkhead associated (FHA) protein